MSKTFRKPKPITQAQCAAARANVANPPSREEVPHSAQDKRLARRG